MAYMNSKFVYIEKKITMDIEAIYSDLSAQRCMLERKSLMTMLFLAIINAPEFAYSYMEQLGYTARVQGEVVRLIRCVPVDVKVE